MVLTPGRASPVSSEPRWADSVRRKGPASVGQGDCGRQQHERGTEDPTKPPNAFQSLWAGLYEIIAAPVALFIWATAMPDSWFDGGKYGHFGPTALVGVSTILIGGVAVVLNRNRS